MQKSIEMVNVGDFTSTTMYKIANRRFRESAEFFMRNPWRLKGISIFKSSQLS